MINLRDIIVGLFREYGSFNRKTCRDLVAEEANVTDRDFDRIFDGLVRDHTLTHRDNDAYELTPSE